MGRAQVAVARTILVSAYWMLTRDEPYRDLGIDWHTRRNDQAHTDVWSRSSIASDTR